MRLLGVNISKRNFTVRGLEILDNTQTLLEIKPARREYDVGTKDALQALKRDFDVLIRDWSIEKVYLRQRMEMASGLTFKAEAMLQLSADKRLALVSPQLIARERNNVLSMKPGKLLGYQTEAWEAAIVGHRRK